MKNKYKRNVKRKQDRNRLGVEFSDEVTLVRLGLTVSQGSSSYEWKGSYEISQWIYNMDTYIFHIHIYVYLLFLWIFIVCFSLLYGFFFRFNHSIISFIPLCFTRLFIGHWEYLINIYTHSACTLVIREYFYPMRYVLIVCCISKNWLIKFKNIILPDIEINNSRHWYIYCITIYVRIGRIIGHLIQNIVVWPWWSMSQP